MPLPSPHWDFGPYKASAQTKANVRRGEADDEISVSGVFVDEIVAVAPMESTIHQNEAAELIQHGRFATESTMQAFYKREWPRYKQGWEIVVDQKIPEIYAPNGQSRKEAFWRTWLCVISLNPFQSESYFGEKHKEWMELVGFKIDSESSNDINDINWLEKAREHN